MLNLKHKYWFILGHQPLISAAEIAAVLNLSVWEYFGNNILITPASAPIDAQNLIKKLGGAVKIGQEIARDISEEKLIAIVAQNLEKNVNRAQKKIIFGLSSYSRREHAGNQTQNRTTHKNIITDWGIQIKKFLKENSHPARYIPNRELILSTATVTNNQLIKKGGEFLIYKTTKNKYALAKTLAVQPFIEFSARDYGRPKRDDLSGMLPPKLAMIMINLARLPRENFILDPFCGSGTILMEEMLLGYQNMIGADKSAQAIENTKKNLHWLIENWPKDHAYPPLTNTKLPEKLFASDVMTLFKYLKPHCLDAIITEPYLGQTLTGRESRQKLNQQAGELKQLYINSFKQFVKLLKKDGVVVFIIPRYKYQQGWITVNCIKEIKKIGFMPINLTPMPIKFFNQFNQDDYLLYHRPGQFIGREIWKFKKIN